MCGLVGCAGLIYNTEKAVFSDMLMLNVFRGEHGCGVLSVVEEKGKCFYEIAKSDSRSSEYVWDADYDDLLKGTGTKILMGHSRHATKGEVVLKNNHPFECGNTIIAHNGTINYTFPGSDKYETDSEALGWLIEEKGLHEALKIIHEEGSPAYALQIWDKKTWSVKLIRNKERPLFYTTAGSTSDLIWNSDLLSMQYALMRHRVSYEKPSILPEHTLLTFNPFVRKEKQFILEHNFFRPPVKTYEYGSNYACPGYYQGRKGYWRGGTFTPTDEKTEETTTTKTATTETKAVNTTTSGTTFPRPFTNMVQIGKIIMDKRAFFNFLARNGCMICGDTDIVVNDKPTMEFTRDAKDYICQNCNTPAIRDEYKIYYEQLVIPRFFYERQPEVG